MPSAAFCLAAPAAASPGTQVEPPAITGLARDGHGFVASACPAWRQARTTPRRGRSATASFISTASRITTTTTTRSPP